MAGINPYSLNPPRMNSGNANLSNAQSIMPQTNAPLSNATTASYSTLQNMQENQPGMPANPMGVSSQMPPGLLASQMRSRSLASAPAVQNSMSMQAQSSIQKQPQQGRQAGQSSAMAMQPTTY